jgi:hypothetical protein
LLRLLKKKKSMRLLPLVHFVQLPGIVRMFAGETTVASAWIHLLAVDLFAARLGTTESQLHLRDAAS